jgi:transcriptional regulator with PAS, ATPase and Fis domain
VVPIVIPPLRHRREDIPELSVHVIEKLNVEFGRSVRGISPEAMQLLLKYQWPGNVRELENILGRAMIAMSPASVLIEAQYLPPISASMGMAEAKTVVAEAMVPGTSLEEVVAGAERSAIVATLAATNGNKTEAAKRLSIAPRTLYYKLEKYGLM